MSSTSIAESVAARLSRSAEEDRFSGAVLIRAAGEILLAAAYGEADREAHIPNTSHTRFRLGSVPKMFTATAAMRLVQDGALSLSARVGDLLPDYPNPDVARTVTVDQLLSHTSGLGISGVRSSSMSERTCEAVRTTSPCLVERLRSSGPGPAIATPASVTSCWAG